MIPGDLSDVPTLACLNKSQKRALILRDQLRYLEPAHLDAFLDGTTTDEPPTYKSVHGAVYPPLAQVTIKEDATRFDLGNVQFPEEGGVTYRAYLTVENERFEMRTEDALPRDDADLRSVAIHRFVAENMFPLFKAKYKAVHARMEKINEARRVAYNMLDHPPAKFEDGETLSRLTVKPKPTDKLANSRKRKEITKHVSNKRPRIGLETIPDTVKSDTFNTIPTHVKVDLFNTIIKTAFPNFDNLITASWNVVSVYSNVGSDFPELHRAIVELKGALEEFESSYAPRGKSGRGRKGGTSSQQGSRSGSRTATPVKEGNGTPSPAVGAGVAAVEQLHDDLSSEVLINRSHKDEDEDKDKDEDEEEEEDEHKADTTHRHQMPPPPPPSQQDPHNKSHNTAGESHLPDPPPPKFHSRAPSSTPPRYTTTTTTSLRNNSPAALYHNHSHTNYQIHRHIPSPTPPPSRPHSRAQSTDRLASPSSTPYPHQHPLAPGSELMRKRMEYTASLERERRRVDGGVAGDVVEEREVDGNGCERTADRCERERIADEKVDALRCDVDGSVGAKRMPDKALGLGLGFSVLGRKKGGLKVPVADMLGRRGGGSGSGNGVRRGY